MFHCSKPASDTEPPAETSTRNEIRGRRLTPEWTFGHRCVWTDSTLSWNGAEARRGGSDGLQRRVAAQSAPTCIGFCRGGECASCGSSGRHWPWWLCLWPHAARCSRRGPGDRPGTCLSPLRSCRTAWSRSVARSRSHRHTCTLNPDFFCGLSGVWRAPFLCFLSLPNMRCQLVRSCLFFCPPSPPTTPAPSAIFNYPGASCSLQFDLRLPESLSYLAGARFSAPLTAQIPEA